MVLFQNPIRMKNKEQLWFNQWELKVFFTMYEWLLDEQDKENIDYQETFLIDKTHFVNEIKRQDNTFTMKRFNNLANEKIKLFEVKISTKQKFIEIKMSEKIFNDFKQIYENPIPGYYWTPEQI